MRKIIYIQYTNPAAYPSLEHSSRILARDGWEVLFLGTGALGADVLRFPPHLNITVRQLPFCPAGWRQKVHYLRFCLWVLAWTVRWRPRWVYASDPLSCPVALLLSCLPGARVIYHEHDSPNTAHSKFMHFTLWARQRLARRTQLCVLPNERRAERFATEVTKPTVNGQRSTVVVWNCPTLDEISPPRPSWNRDDLWVFYHGSIVPSRLPPAVLSALAMLPDTVKLRVVGYETVGHKGYVQQLQEVACRLGVSEQVNFLGTVPTRIELFDECRRCDVGLAFMPKNGRDINEQTMTGASNKPFDYLACGLALLVSDLPDWRAMYVEPGYGLACDPGDPQSIAAALRWFLEHPTEMRAMGERGRQRIINEWNYERQFEPLLKLLRT